MVRRAILDRDELPVDEHQILPDDDQLAADPEPPQRSQPWRGAGGRWLIWAGRAVVWAVLLLVGYRGVLAIVHDESGSGVAKPAAAPPAARPAATSFPVSLAEAYALDFGSAYLNFSPAGAAQRAQALAQFITSGSDPQLGWNGAGTQRLESEQVAGISVKSQHSAVVTLLATVSGGRLLELGVPVYVSRGRISVSGAPALFGPPAKATLPSSTASADQATVSALQRQLPAFFQAYAGGDPSTLTRFVAPGGHVKGLGGLVTFGGIDAVFVPAGGSTRSATVTVTWQLPSARGQAGKVAGASAALQMSYQLTIVRQGGSWDVRTIGALDHPRAPGPP